MKKVKILIIILIVLGILGITTVVGINQYVKAVASKNITEDVQSVEKAPHCSCSGGYGGGIIGADNPLRAELGRPRPFAPHYGS